MTVELSSRTRTLFTIGYEGRDVEDVLSRVAEAGVTTLVDVRYRPQSRKRGFSRLRLEALCATAGIAYVHIRALGTPPEMMRRFGAGGYDAATFKEYRHFLRDQREALMKARQLIASGTCCLLCYEADASTCHRHIVADEVSGLAGTTVQHL